DLGLLRHVVREQVEVVQRVGVLDRTVALLAGLRRRTGVLRTELTALAAVALAWLPRDRAERGALGDDDELARAGELLVHLAEGDVVRVVGVEERGAGRRVADLELGLVVDADPEQYEQRGAHGPATPALGEPDQRALDDLVDPAEEIAEGVGEAADGAADA